MSKQYSWADTRERAAAELGSYPDAALEAEIMEAFRERPAFVVDAIAGIVSAYKSGRIHSPWLLLRKKVTASALTLVVDDSSERESAIARAESWVRTAGLHFERESEVEDELFGLTGMLRAWANDEALSERLLALWRAERPRGEAVEAEAQASAERRIAVREKVLAASKPTAAS